jgi:hypothetical protein
MKSVQNITGLWLKLRWPRGIYSENPTPCQTCGSYNGAAMLIGHVSLQRCLPYQPITKIKAVMATAFFLGIIRKCREGVITALADF